MRLFTLLLILFGSLTAVLTLNQNTFAEGSGYKKADLKNGAQLYDNWIKMKKTDIKDTHPLYPVKSKKSGKSTWRCKECHGWDYIGKDGRYKKGSHFTGIVGVYHMRNVNPEGLYVSLKDKMKNHDFSHFLNDNDIWDLVKFMREGQEDIKMVLDEQGLAKGDATRGKVLYNTNCESCHGIDGTELDFKGKKDGIQAVGWLTNDNPQESIHKIRWGHPGSDMPSMKIDKSLSEKDSIDILTYSQSLDNK